MTWTQNKELRLLLIDDDDIDGQLLRIYLGKISQRIEFRHCVNEDEALNVVGSEEFDLIFVDNRLALWTGPEMLEALRERGYEGPTVLYTAAIDNSIVPRLRELNCYDFLEKGDVTLTSLKSTIQSAMSRYSSN